MTLREYLKSTGGQAVSTPAYYFDADSFAERAAFVKGMLPNIPLTFSIKANPFLLNCLPETIVHVEVCSPGELAICQRCGIPGSRIIYSGVNKELRDMTAAVRYGADMVTAESIQHAGLAQQAAQQAGVVQKVLLRLTSGNQFGMSEEDILSLLTQVQDYPNLQFYGIHYYSGTQKKKRQIDKDFERLEAALQRLRLAADFAPQLVEMGPGLPVDYFTPPYEETERQTLQESAPAILAFAQKYPLGIEMGRYLAAPCGTYATRVMDIKNNSDTNYIICDGGIHHLRYYGQTMAMQMPEMEALTAKNAPMVPYCICGSLCTVADVLVREAELPAMHPGDVLLFHRCGAYSVTEGSALFLSRTLPEVYLYSQKQGLQRLRGFKEASKINQKQETF